MATWYVDNSTPYGGAVTAPWQASTAYALNQRVVIPPASVALGTNSRFVYQCTTAGTSGSSAPAWPTTVGNTVTDGTAVWTCRSPSDGNWGDAACYLYYLMAQISSPLSAGDVIYIHKNHSESDSQSTNQVLFSGPTTGWVNVYCVDNTNSNALSTGAIINVSSGVMILENRVYSYGVQYRYSGATGVYFGDSTAAYWILESNGAFDVIYLNADSIGCKWESFYSSMCPTQVDIVNAGVYFAYAANGFNLSSTYPLLVRWKGGILHAPNGATNLFGSGMFLAGSIVEDVDLSAVGSGATATSLINTSGIPGFGPLFTRCKLPSSSATGFAFDSGTLTYPQKLPLRLHGCSASNTVEEIHEIGYEGTVTYNASIYGAATDGAAPFSLQMAASSNTVDGLLSLESPPITAWCSLTGSHAFTIQCIVDSASDLTNADIWMELEYPADASSGLGATATDRVAPLGAPTAKTSSTATWTGSGTLTYPNKFICQVAASPAKVGPVTARVHLTKPSTTVYVDPIITMV